MIENPPFWRKFERWLSGFHEIATADSRGKKIIDMFEYMVKHRTSFPREVVSIAMEELIPNRQALDWALTGLATWQLATEVEVANLSGKLLRASPRRQFEVNRPWLVLPMERLAATGRLVKGRLQHPEMNSIRPKPLCSRRRPVVRPPQAIGAVHANDFTRRTTDPARPSGRRRSKVCRPETSSQFAWQAKDG